MPQRVRGFERVLRWHRATPSRAQVCLHNLPFLFPIPKKYAKTWYRSPFGQGLVRELNRLGVLIDLSHTSDATALAALNLSRAPVIWSHSSARALRDIPRNVPDDVLRHVGMGTGQRDGIVMVRTLLQGQLPELMLCRVGVLVLQVNFYPGFLSEDPDEADVETVADHFDHIASVAGRAQYASHFSYILHHMLS
jgi:microsomal dipeptidase-like Zn-dependent dipeptidase